MKRRRNLPIRVWFLLTAVALLQFGCDAEYAWEYKMYNGTDEVITIYRFVESNNQQIPLDTSFIDPYRYHTLHTHWTHGWYKDGVEDKWEENEPAPGLSSMRITIQDTLQSTIDYSDRSVWMFVRPNNWHAYYVTVIRPQDF